MRLTDAELAVELGADGVLRSVVHAQAIIRLGLDDDARLPAVYERLRRALAAGVERLDVGASRPRSMQVVFGLLRLSDRLSAAERADAAVLTGTLAARLEGPPSFVARAAALLLANRASELAAESANDALLARHGAQAYLWLPSLPAESALLFGVWIRELERAMAHSGSTAFRAFLGDVAEAAFRALCHGAAAEQLLGEQGAAFLVDACCAELGGTTDFIAARAMTWLVGVLARDDDTAHAAIERARARFRDASFQSDCTAILASGAPWPPA
jgi:hypothetical protein